MIDEEATFKKYGYYSTDLKPHSNKHVVAVCDGCGAIRYLEKSGYRDLCHPCANQTDEHRKRTSKLMKGVPKSDEHRKAIADGHNGIKMPPRTDEARQHMSAGIQGIPYEDWTGFVSNGAYCEKFDDACRERIRAKYGHRCYICDKPQDENITKKGKTRKLNVHHVDMNKDQGCNGNEWKLIPLCMHCHQGAHRNPLKSRIEYLRADEECAHV